MKRKDFVDNLDTVKPHDPIDKEHVKRKLLSDFNFEGAWIMFEAARLTVRRNAPKSKWEMEVMAAKLIDELLEIDADDCEIYDNWFFVKKKYGEFEGAGKVYHFDLFFAPFCGYANENESTDTRIEREKSRLHEERINNETVYISAGVRTGRYVTIPDVGTFEEMERGDVF